MNSLNANASTRTILLIATVAFSARGHLGSQTKSPASTGHKSLSANTSCYDEAGKLVGSRTARTSELVSPDGKFRAYAERSAVAAESPDKPECRNISELFIAGRGQSFHAVLTVEPSAEAPGSSIEIIDWSPVGHRLLLEQGFWQYGSDVGGTVVRIYYADSDRLSGESLMDDAFGQHAGKKCAANFSPLGFSRTGDAVVRVAP
jgi:hypothetical protein